MATVDDYRFGSIVVDGRRETRDLIILPGRVVTEWWRNDGHLLVMDDLAEVLDELPERLVVGTGASGRMRPDPAAVEELARHGVHVEALKTPEAVRRYIDLDPGKTAAALHLTC